MASSLQKSRIKLSAILILVASAAALITTLTVNTVLFFSKKAITRSIERYFPRTISIGACVYMPPWYIILKDVTFNDPLSPAKKPVLHIPSIHTRVSLLKFIATRQIFISKLSVLKPKTEGYAFICFLRDNYEQIMSFIKQLPKQNIKFSVKDFVLTLTDEQANASHFSCDAKFIIKNDWVFSNGVIRQYSSLGQGAPVRYKGKGFLTHDGMNLSKFEVTKENFYAQVWGSLKGNHLRWNGFMFMNTAFQDSEYLEPGFDIFEELKNYLSRFRATQADIMLPRANLYLLDIDSQVTLAFPHIQLEKMNFSLNNNPMSVKGTISLTNPISLDLSASAYLRPLGETMVENLKRIDLGIKGIVQAHMLQGQGSLSLNFVTKKSGNPPLQKAEVNLEALRVYFDTYPNFKADAQSVNLFFRTESNEYRIALKNLQAFFHLAKEKFKFVSFKSQLYDGVLQGWGRMNMGRFPPPITAIAKINNVSAHKLAGILVHFSKVYGRLDSLMHFQTHPDLDLEGRMYVQSGYLKNFEFFKWLANFLSLDALRKVDFRYASSNFTVNPEGARLHEIKLDSQDLGLAGYFSLGAKDMVSSKLSLQCSKELLRQSPKFAPLVRLIEADVPHVSLDFQLSGNLNSMNFQWLQSDFKRRLQKSIPNFIERRIEKNIEDLVESVSAR